MSSSSSSSPAAHARTAGLSRSQALSSMTLKRQPHKTYFMVSRGVDASSPPPSSKAGNTLRAHKTGGAAPPAVYTRQGTYTGDWRENRRNGFGVQTYLPSGERYEGEWSENVRHGKGVLYAPRHGALMRVYEGDFAYGKFHGRGTMYYANGDM
jgi:hypothetical protein